MPKVTDLYKMNRRIEILESANKIFSEKGYTSMVMQDVIDMMGLSRGALYSYFANKEDLYRAVIEHQDENGIWPEIDALRNATPLWPALIEHLAYVEMNNLEEEQIRKSIGAQFEYVISGRSNDERKTWVIDRYQRILDSYISILENARDRSELRPRMPINDIVQFIISINDGVNMARTIVGPEAINIKGQNTALLSFLEYALNPVS